MNKRCAHSLVPTCVVAGVIALVGLWWAGPGMRELHVARTDTGLTFTVFAQMAREAAAVSFYVDGAAGNDANEGSSAKPFKSIQRGVSAAAAQNRLGRPVTAYIKPATYREAVAFPTQKFTAAPVTLISTVPGGAVIDGSDLYTGWTLASGTIYAHSWTPLPACECPYDAQNCPPGIGMRREMVFVNGQLLRQVASRAAMKAGTYTVDDGARRLYVWTPTGASPDSMTTTVSTRGNLFSATTGVQNLTLNGIVVRGSSDCAAVGAAIDIENVADVVLQDVSAVWNNDEGIFISGAKRTFQLTHVHADNNGFIGMGIHNTKNLRATDSTTNGNTWRGKWVNFGGWFSAGVKFGGLHQATINRWTSNDNWSNPFWFDTDCRDVVVNDLVSRHNAGSGVVFEVCQGPITLNRPILCQNGTPYGGSAILGQGASDVTVSGAIIFQNDPNTGTMVGIGIGAVGEGAPETLKDWETGQTISVRSRRWTVQHCAIVCRNAGQFVFETDTNNVNFWQTLTADHNVYWNPDDPQAFSNTPHNYDFSRYKALPRAGQEAHSVWANPFQNDPTGTCTFVGARGVWPR